jgi:hypothetical protein
MLATSAADVSMGCGAALILRARERAGKDHFQRRRSVEPQVFGAEDDSHPAVAEDAQHLVAGHVR